MEVQAEITLRF